MSSSLVGDILAIALFIIVTFGVLCGFPIAFSLAGFSLVFAALAGMPIVSLWNRYDAKHIIGVIALAWPTYHGR